MGTQTTLHNESQNQQNIAADNCDMDNNLP